MDCSDEELSGKCMIINKKKTICRQAPTVQECQQEQDQCQQEQDQCQQEQDQGPPVPETKISFDSAGRGRR